MELKTRVIQLEAASSVIRKELKNLRKQVESLKFMVQSEIHKIRDLVTKERGNPHSEVTGRHEESCVKGSENSCKSKEGVNKSSTGLSLLSAMSIGRMKTCFKEKNGTPRQPSLCSKAPGSLTVEVFGNPDHSLEGLKEYSHVWLLFVFHLNAQDAVKAKVRPPRLNGQKVGVFASRSPHRPCPIGLTLAKVEEINNGTLHVSGIDLVDGTPVLDVKPYIPQYDCPWTLRMDDIQLKTQTLQDLEAKDCYQEEGWAQPPSGHVVTVAGWLSEPPVSCLQVEFLPHAKAQLNKFGCRRLLSSAAELSTTSVIVSSKSGKTHASEDKDTRQEEGTELGHKGFRGGEHLGVRSESKSGAIGYNKLEDQFYLESFASIEEVRQAIVEMLRQDPRSVYRRTKCTDQSYQVSIDNLNLTCMFVGNKCIVTDVQPKTVWKDNV